MGQGTDCVKEKEIINALKTKTKKLKSIIILIYSK